MTTFSVAKWPPSMRFSPRLRAVDPLVMFDLAGQYRVAAALCRLIENVGCGVRRHTAYRARKRCARLGEEL